MSLLSLSLSVSLSHTHTQTHRAHFRWSFDKIYRCVPFYLIYLLNKTKHIAQYTVGLSKSET